MTAAVGWMLAIASAAGCGYLDEDLHKTREEFEESFECASCEGMALDGTGSSGEGSGYSSFGCGGVRGTGHVDIDGIGGDVTPFSVCRAFGGQYCRRADGAGGIRSAFRTRCRRGHGRACALLALLYRHGATVERDPDRAQRLLDEACEAGFETACEEEDDETDEELVVY